MHEDHVCERTTRRFQSISCYEGSVDKENKAYRPNAHLLYIVMHYNGNFV